MIKENASSSFGGGISNLGLLNLSDSQVVKNTSTLLGGGIYNNATATLERTLIWGSREVEVTSGSGGGIYNDELGELTLHYSVVVNNSSDTGGAGIQSKGNIDIRSSIITNNEVVGSSTGSAGGLYINRNDPLDVHISDSVIANNTASGRDVDVDRSSNNQLVSSGFNLIENASNFEELNTDIINIDPLFDSVRLINDQLSLEINEASAILNSGSSLGIGDITMAGTVVDSTANIGGITTNFEGGLVFWVGSSGDIFRSSPAFTFNQRIVASSGAGNFTELEVNTAQNRLFFLVENTDNNVIKSSKLDGTDVKDEISVSSDAVSFAIDADDQRIYVAVAGTDPSIIQYDMSVDSVNPVIEEIASLTGRPTDIEYDDQNQTLYWSSIGEDASIESLQRDSSDPQIWQDSPIGLTDATIDDIPFEIAIDESNNVIYWSDEFNDSLSSFDPNRNTEVLTERFIGNGRPQAVVFNTLDNDLLVSNNNNSNSRVLSVDSSLDSTGLASLSEFMLRSDFVGLEADEQTVIFVGPTPLTNGGINVREGVTELLNNQNLEYLDDDSRPDQITYTHNTSVPDVDENIGELIITVDTIVTDTFTQDDINNRRVRITHNGVHESTESIWTIGVHFDVTDHNSVLMDTTVFDVRVTNINDAPVFTTGDAVVVNNADPVQIGIQHLITSDEDTAKGDIRYDIVFSHDYSFVKNMSDTTSFTAMELENDEIFFRYSGAQDDTTIVIPLLVSDGNTGVDAILSVVLDLDPVNDNAPVAVDHTVSGKRNDILDSVEPLSGESNTNTLLHGSSDEDLPDDALEVRLVSGPSSGLLDVRADGTFTYSVDESIPKDSTVLDSFTYEIIDEVNNVSPPATVSIEVEGLQRPAINGDLSDVTVDELQSLDHTFEQDVFTSSETSEPFEWSIHIDNRPIPAWLSLDKDTGTLSGTPADSDVESFELHVLVTDEHGLESDEVPIMITINDINQTPVIHSAPTEIVEENSEGQLVATVNASDPDANDVLIYSTDDSRFRFDDNKLKLREFESLDFETDEEVVLTVTVDDQQGGIAVSEEITIQVTNVNEPPTLEITDLVVVQENTSDVDIGTVTVDDPDAGAQLDVTVSDARFEIVGDKLRVRAGEELDFDTEPQVLLTVSVTDGVNDPVSQEITVTVTNVNEPPTLEITDLVDVQENTSDVVVATVTVSDPDAGAKLDVIVSDDRFEVVGDELRLRAGKDLNFEIEPQVSLTVSVQDEFGLRVTREVDITVLNVNEIPVQTIAVPDQQIEEGNVLTSMFNAYIDPDGDELTYALTLANGDVLPSWLVFDQVAGELRTGDLPRDEVSARLKLSADDGNGGVLQLEFTVSFLPEPEIGFGSPLEEELPDIEIIEFAPEVPSAERESELEISTDTEPEESTEPRTAGTSDALLGIFIDGDDDPVTVGISRTNAISEFLSAQSESRADGSDIRIMQRDVFDESTSLTDLFTITSQLDPNAFSSYQENFEKQREIFESDIAASKGIVVSSITLSSGLSVGYILYLLRGGAIMTSMLSSLPAWRFVDPLPILGHMEDSLNGDDESLETLVTESRQ